MRMVYKMDFTICLLFVDYGSAYSFCIPLSPPQRAFFWVRQAWRVARKRNQLGCGGHAGDLEVQVLYTPGKGKC